MTTTTSAHGSVSTRVGQLTSRRRRRDDPTLARLFARFALTGLIAMIVIGAAGVVLLQRAATSRAIREAENLTHLAGRGIIEPLITPGLLRGVPADLARLDRVVHGRILTGTPIVRVKIWNAQGRVIYSDAASLIGSQFPLEADELRALRTAGTIADASDLTNPENRTERGFNRLLEVYFGISGPAGTHLLYEDYERSSTVSANSRRQWTSLLPALLGGLLVLYLVQVPLAYSLARRLRAKQQEREELLRRAIDASDLERRRVAADLHDGAVQRLAGISLALAAAARRPRPGSGAEATSKEFAVAASGTRETIRELRTLLVDIYPPTLKRSGLPAALDDLVAPLTAAGIEVNLRLPESFSAPDDVSALLYRIAQEAIRNTRAHAEATAVDVCVEQHGAEAVLTVTDDGRGFSAQTGGARGEDEPIGHFGLRLMRDLINHAGGTLEVQSSPERGTIVRATVALP